MKKKLAVLVSGTGSIFQAMLDKKLSVELVIADRPCKGLEIAKAAGIPAVLLERTFGKDFDREKYTQDAIDVLKKQNIALVAMAGYMTVFAAEMFEEENFKNQVINIHPSILPDFKGDHAVRDALAAGVKETGTTVHYATAKLDDGEYLAQEKVPVLPGDTESTLHERIKQVERRLFPEVISRLL